MDWKAALGLKKKSRREKMQEAAAEVIHKVADVVEEAVTESRRKAPQVAKQAGKAAEHLLESADELGESVREKASASAETIREQSDAQVSSMLAALGGLTANWDELLQTLDQEMKQRSVKRPQGKKKARSYPGFWIWLLRLGVGFWFIERLRSRDVAGYIDHGAGEEMRTQSRNHPVEWYKDLLDTLLIPNASLVALTTLTAEALVALGFITGLNRRLAALLGLVLSGNELLAHHNDSEKRGQDLLVLLSQILLLRTGG